MIYEYRYYVDMYCDISQMRITEETYRDMKALSSVDFNGCMSDQTHRMYMPTSLPLLLMGETLFDKELDFEAYTNDYFDFAFGEDGKKVGKYKVTIKLKGNYSGTLTAYFTIVPKESKVEKLTAAKKSLKVRLTKVSSQATGYEIQYSTSKDFSNAKTKTITSNSTVKTTLSSLSSGKTYYVRVRTYKTVNDVKYYSAWSASKNVKTK